MPVSVGLVRQFTGLCKAALPLLWLFSAASRAAFPPVNIQFENVGNPQQIPDNVVTALAQDSTGYLWIGTAAGLVRYDGYRFKLFSHDDQDPYSLAGNFVQSIHTLDNGQLWVSGEPGGVSFYDPRQERFEQLFDHQTLLENSPLSSVSVVHIGPRGDIWLATPGGVFRVNPDREIEKHYQKDHGLSHNSIRAIFSDSKGNLWVGSRGGLNRYDWAEDRFVAIHSSSSEPLSNQLVRSLFESQDGRLWIGTDNDGVWILDVQTQQLTPALSGIPKKLMSGPVYEIAQPNEDELWLARFGGIDRVDAHSGAWLSRIYHDPSNSFSLSNNDIRTLLKDRAGQMWAGGYGSGLQHSLGKLHGLGTLRFSMQDDNALSAPNVSSVLERRNGQIWIGTRGEGVDIYERHKGVVDGHYPQPDVSGKLQAGWIATMAETPNEDVWLGVNPGLLYRYDNHTGQFQRYDEASGFDNANVRALHISSRGDVWIGTNRGLRYWDSQTDRIHTLTMANGEPMLDGINALYEDESGRLLVATGATGLYSLTPSDTGLRTIEGQTEQGRDLRTVSIVGMLKDSQQRLWIDTPAGLYQVHNWQGAQVTLTNVSRRAGFGDRPMGANLQEDHQGRIWTPSFIYHPDTGKMQPLHRADGIDIGTSWFRAHGQTHDGILMYGGSKGLLFIDPAAFSPWQYQPPLVASDLRINGRAANAGDLEQSGLTLTSQKQSFSIEFAALDLSAPERNLYRYKLQGFDKNWIETDATRRQASYSNLWPGHYTLLVEGTNRNGQWSDKQLSIPVRIKPAYWQTPWFMALVGLAVLLAVFAIIGLRTRMITARARALEALVDERTKELQQTQKDMIEQEKMASLGGLVAGVAHEINTPMGIALTAASGLNEFTHKLMHKLDANQLSRKDLSQYAEQVKESNRLILTSLERARVLVSSFKQVAVDQTSEQRRTFDLKDFLEDLQHSMHPVYKQHHQLHLDCPSGIELDTYPGALFQVLSNLINNSVVHGFREGENGEMRIEATQEENDVVLVYTDNGKGMDNEVLKKAFDPFFTTRRGHGGSGLGLHLVYNFVTQLLGGVINLHSKPGQGIRCVIRIPGVAPLK
ncbi:sensor histidine kinase [Lacimicrobium sp. SS2-24]|uniref:sensor histidine kinase n=1 Tax=Lacimicrobium sp. SS2-24 TaxID=2005569 RepID=UPI000B4B709C|nr:sensor histidine kinase [Lacimicrobium sp. SS2-24]